MLLPEQYRVSRFKDSSALLGDSVALGKQAAETGYLYLAGFLPESLLEPVRKLAREAYAARGWVQAQQAESAVMEAVPGARLKGRGWDDPNWVSFQYEFSKHPALLNLAECAKVTNVLEAIMGEPAWTASINFCWLKLPGSPEHTTLPHQDQWYLPRCPSMWTMWVPFVDTPYDLGPLAVLPGSHRRGMLHHQDAFSGIAVAPDAEWASSEVRTGDVVFFGALTVHCAWSNVSPTRARVSADIRYEPSRIGPNSLLRRP